LLSGNGAAEFTDRLLAGVFRYHTGPFLPEALAVLDFIPGQRWISDTELQMGLGTVLSVDFRTVTVLFGGLLDAPSGIRL